MGLFVIVALAFVGCGFYLLFNCHFVLRDVREPRLLSFVRPASVWTAVAAVLLIAAGVLFVSGWMTATIDANSTERFGLEVVFSVLAVIASLYMLLVVLTFHGFGYFCYGALRLAGRPERAAERIAQEAECHAARYNSIIRRVFLSIVAFGTFALVCASAVISFLIWMRMGIATLD